MNHDGKASPLRPWRDVATDLANETDPNRILELSLELGRAIDMQTLHIASGDYETPPPKRGSIKP